MKRNIVSRYVATGLAGIGVFMAIGCATTDTVSSRFPQLQENINAAKAADAEVYAPTPLKSAEAKLEAAKSAVAAKDMVSANKLVDEAMVDADYARAMAPTEKAKNAAMKLREAIQVVRDEIKKMPAAK
ncbi:MAG: DUF4398 domain-containing protein [Syntrophales bacterium]|jgi:hypothetical protein|nr:DUF4398 domain-containing protein [Syntrophales bacterium]